MKIAPREVTRYLEAAAPAATRAFLFHGPDQGVADTHIAQLLAARQVDRRDAFAFQELQAARLAQTPGLLLEALSSISLSGQAPCVLIRDASDAVTPAVKEALVSEQATNLLILQAGELSPRSSLRRFMEQASRKELAAIACYRDEGANLARFLRTELGKLGIEADRAAMEALCALLGNDRGVSLRELDKLDLYLGPQRRLDEASVLALLADNQHGVLSDAALLWLSDKRVQACSLLDQLLAQGESAVACVRVLIYHTGRLQQILGAMAREGRAAESAIAELQPPVFYKDKPRYLAACSVWNAAQITQLCAWLQGLEAAIKRSPSPELILLQGLTLPACLASARASAADPFALPA